MNAQTSATWLMGSRMLQKGRGLSSQGSCLTALHSPPRPGPAAPAAALRTGGDHSADLASHQQAGRRAAAALPGLAHRDRFHRLPPMEGQPLSKPSASAHGGEERLRHQGQEGREDGQGRGRRECRQGCGATGGRGEQGEGERGPGIDESLKMTQPSVVTVLGSHGPISTRFQERERWGILILYLI